MIITWLLSGTDSLFVTFVASFPPSLRSGANNATRATNKLHALQKSCDCSIYMVKPVGPRCGQMERKNLDWWILSQNRVYHLYKSVPFTEKRPRRPKTGLKDGVEEMEHEFPFRIFRLERQDYLFRCSVTPGNLPTERTKCHVPFSFLTDFPETFCE